MNANALKSLMIVLVVGMMFVVGGCASSGSTKFPSIGYESYVRANIDFGGNANNTGFGKTAIKEVSELQGTVPETPPAAPIAGSGITGYGGTAKTEKPSEVSSKDKRKRTGKIDRSSTF